MNRCVFQWILVALALCSGCSSRKPPPPKPAPVALADRTADQAAQLSQNQNWPAAVREWQRALDRFRLLNDLSAEAVALHNLAQAERELDALDDAREHLLEAASLNERTNHRRDWWLNQIALLQVESRQDRTNDLGQRFDLLQKRAGEERDSSLDGLFLNELGLWRERSGQWEASAEAFERSRQRFESAGDALGVATVIANQAQLLEKQDKHAAALAQWEQALTRFEALADPPGITRSLAGEGRVLLKIRDDLPRAEDLLRRAARNYQTLDERDALRATLQLLLQALQAQQKSEAADKVRAQLESLGAK